MEEFPGPFLVDNMEDEASKLYGAHPERLYIILDGNIVYQVCFKSPIVNSIVSQSINFDF